MASCSRIRAFADHRSNTRKSKFLSTRLCSSWSSSKCSVSEQKRRQVWSDAEREELVKMQRTSKRSTRYRLGTGFAHLTGQMALALQPKNKKPPTGEINK